MIPQISSQIFYSKIWTLFKVIIKTFSKIRKKHLSRLTVFSEIPHLKITTIIIKTAYRELTALQIIFLNRCSAEGTATSRQLKVIIKLIQYSKIGKAGYKTDLIHITIKKKIQLKLQSTARISEEIFLKLNKKMFTENNPF